VKLVYRREIGGRESGQLFAGLAKRAQDRLEKVPPRIVVLHEVSLAFHAPTLAWIIHEFNGAKAPLMVKRRCVRAIHQ
jgi:hypothetical protein